MSSAPAFSQVTWNGATNGNWGSSNWLNVGGAQGSLANNFTSDLVFAGSTNLSTNNNLTGGTPANLTFNAGAGSFTLAGNAITLSGSISNNATNAQTISLPVVLTSASHAVNTVSGGSLVISGSISGGNVDGSNTLFLNTAGGTLTLSGNNTYTGLTTISAGALVVGSANALGSGTVRFTNSTNVSLDVTSGQAFNIANGVALNAASGTFVGSGNGSLISTGTLYFSSGNRTMGVGSGTFGVAMVTCTTGSQTFTKVGAGTFVITGSSAILGTGANGVVGRFDHNGGVVAIGNNYSLGSGTYNSLGNSNVLRGYSGDLTAIPNPVLLGTGTTTFDGNYSLNFTGNTIETASRDIVNNVAAGKSVTFSGTTFLQDSTMSGGRSLAVRGTGTTNFTGSIVDGGITGSGTISAQGGILMLSGSNSLTGGVGVGTGGLLLINHPNALGSGSFSFGGTGSFDMVYGSPISVANNIRMGGGSGTFVGSTNGAFTTTGTLFFLGSNRTLAVSSGTVEVGGLSTNAGLNYRFTKSGSGTMIINNAADATVTGSFALNGGTLILGNAAALGSGTFESASSTNVIRAKSADLSISNLVYLTTNTTTFDGSYGLSFTGSLTMNNDRRVVNNIAVGKSLTFSGATSLLGSGTDRTLTILGTGNTLFSGSISDGGSTGSGFTQASTGTTTLSVANTYTGTTTVSSGRLVIGNATSLGNGGGRLAVGGGVLDLGGFTVTRTGSIAITGSGTIQNGTLSNSTTAFDAQGGTVSAVLAGLAGLTKTTTGTVSLAVANSYSGNTTVSDGRLVAGNAGAFGSGAITVNGGTLDFGSFAVSNALTMNGGSLANGGNFAGATTITGTVALASVPNSAVTIAAGGVLQGTPTVASLAGAGFLSPGNSPGIVTAGTLDPSGGMSFGLEFTGSTPDYGNASSSVNDVIRLTGGSPFVSNLTSSNVVNVYFNVASFAANDTFEGGFFTTLSANDLLTALGSATYNFFGQAPGGSVSFNGQNYDPILNFAGITGVNVLTKAATANFSSGTVNGSVAQFVIVPEPTSLALVGLGVAGLALARRLRRAAK